MHIRFNLQINFPACLQAWKRGLIFKLKTCPISPSCLWVFFCQTQKYEMFCTAQDGIQHKNPVIFSWMLPIVCESFAKYRQTGWLVWQVLKKHGVAGSRLASVWGSSRRLWTKKPRNKCKAESKYKIVVQKKLIMQHFSSKTFLLYLRLKILML